MTFPENREDVNTNMPESNFNRLIVMLVTGDYVDISKINTPDWFVNLESVRYEITSCNGVIDGIYRR